MFIQVTASAGSGKTYQLTRRFLELLLGALEGPWPPVCSAEPRRRHAPAEIMAITFTNRAAAEMKQRLVASLKALALRLEGAHGPEGMTPEVAASHLDAIFRHYQRLQIRTIDSLLVMLARLFAVELGVAPDFETVFDEADILTPLYDRLVSRAESGIQPEASLLARAARDFAGAGGFLPSKAWNDRLRDMFAFRLDNREELAKDPQAFERLREVSRDRLAGRARDLARALEQAGCTPKAQFRRFLELCAALPAHSKCPDSAYAGKSDLTDCVLSAGKKNLTPDLEAAYAALKDCLARHDETAVVAGTALDMLALADVADALVGGLEGDPAERGRMAHARIAHMVRQALSRDVGVPDAFCRLGARLAHLLIDEFQDTSRTQWQALLPLAQECLAKGGGLFMVGDVKQAIYGWRGGEATLFAEAARDPELCAVGAPEIMDLESNWRSAKRIVEFNNAFFSALADPDRAEAAADALAPQLPAKDLVDLAERISLAFAGCAQKVPPSRAGRPEGLVSLRPTPGASRDEVQAGVKTALEEVLRGDVLARRPMSDTAVLVRTNDNAAEVARWLLEWGIPAVTENSLRLAERPVVRQLTALLSFLDYPLDDAAFWEFVSGPEIFGAASGIDRTTLFDWLATLGPGALYTRFRRDFPEAWDRLIRPYFNQAGLTSAYDLAAEVIKAMGLLGRLPGDEGFLRRFLEVVYVSGLKGHGSLAAFLDFWRRKGAEEIAPSPERLDAVRIMTMHKAKGLEFPVVIVPFQAMPAPKADDMAVVEKYGLRFAAKLTPHAGDPYCRKIAARSLEQLNLMYVAWTRAAEELHLFLQPEAARTSPLAAIAGQVLHTLGIDVDRDPDQGPVELGERPPAAGPTRPGPQPAPRLAPAAPTARAVEPLRWLPRLKIFRNTVRELRPEQVLTEAARGRAAHKALEHFRPGRDPEAAAARAAALATADLTLPGPVLAGLEAELAGMLRWLAGLSGFAGYLDRGQREREILDPEGESHRPDLYVEDESGILVIDYKTGTIDAGHLTQLRRYLGLLRDIRPKGPPPRGLIAYLDLRQTIDVALPAPGAAPEAAQEAARG